MVIILYDNPANETLINCLQKTQYKAYLAITGVIQGTSRDSLYQQLNLSHYALGGGIEK